MRDLPPRRSLRDLKLEELLPLSDRVHRRLRDSGTALGTALEVDVWDEVDRRAGTAR